MPETGYIEVNASRGGKTLIYPIFLPMQGCEGKCIYCDQNKISGADADSLEASLGGAEEFLLRHRGVARQVAFYGGTFTALDREYREALLRRLLAASDSLASFRVSTHPGYIDPQILAWCGQWRISTIELGIQDFSDEVLAASKRGYSGAQALEAANLVRRYGFELGVQLMPGLPGWTEASLDYNQRMLVRLKPDLLRLYPLIVLKGTPLADLWQQGTYQPLTLGQAISQCADYLSLATPLGIRVIKLGLPSNLDPADVLAGPWHAAFGELVKAELLYRDLCGRYPEGAAIILPSSEYNLLKSHGGRCLKKLEARHNNCMIEDGF